MAVRRPRVSVAASEPPLGAADWPRPAFWPGTASGLATSSSTATQPAAPCACLCRSGRCHSSASAGEGVSRLHVFAALQHCCCGWALDRDTGVSSFDAEPCVAAVRAAAVARQVSEGEGSAPAGASEAQHRPCVAEQRRPRRRRLLCCEGAGQSPAGKNPPGRHGASGRLWWQPDCRATSQAGWGLSAMDAALWRPPRGEANAPRASRLRLRSRFEE